MSGDNTDDGDGDGRTKRITFYVSESERADLQREANAEGKSLSKYVLDLTRKQRRDEGVQALSEDLKVEKRLQELVAEATEDITEAAEGVEQRMDDIADIHAAASTYPIVNFYALKRQFDLPETWIDDRFRHASAKLDLDDEGIVGPNVDADDRGGDQDHDHDGHDDRPARERLEDRINRDQDQDR